jgi:L-malate glycosyltransferase
MKILVLNYEYPPLGGGGGRACADLCHALAQRGHSLKVITAMASGLERREELDGYLVIRTASGRRSHFRASFPAMLGYLIGAFIPALREIRKWQPDLIHVHFAVPTGILALLLSWITGKPYVLTAHLGDVPGGVPQKTGKWFRVVYPFTPPIWKNARRIAAVSDYTRSLALKHYDVPIEVIPNGVQLPASGSFVEETQISTPPRLIFAGRFQPQKNLPFLLDALASVSDLDWNCEMVGDGPQRAMLEEKALSLGIGQRLRFHGWISSDEVWNLLGKSDLLVMPSLSEGLPVVGVQALGQGLAFAANRAGGLIDLVKDGKNGRLCDVGDEVCYQMALRWCLEDTDRLLKLKKASREHAANFDIKAIAQSYEKVFRIAIRTDETASQSGNGS